MISLTTFLTPRHECAMRPWEEAQLQYEVVAAISDAEYLQRLNEGWRRFGHSLFKPACPACQGCQSLRVLVNQFQPDRSQRRAVAANADVTLEVVEPAVTDEVLDLYAKFHDARHAEIGWPDRGRPDEDDFRDSFVTNPVATQQWEYRLHGELIGTGYVDALPDGLSAIYFIHDPELAKRSLGTFNVMTLLAAAARRRLPYLYLGYLVEGCRSLEYKARYRPNQILTPEGAWVPYREQ